MYFLPYHGGDMISTMTLKGHRIMKRHDANQTFPKHALHWLRLVASLPLHDIREEARMTRIGKNQLRPGYGR
jgi:hypothetical protein